MEQSLEISTKQTVDKALQGLILEEAKNFKVDSAESKKTAATRRDMASAAIKQIETFFGPHIRNAHKAWKDLTGSKANVLTVPQLIMDSYKRSIMGYDQEQINVRRKAEIDAREAARTAEEDNRITVAAELERDGRHHEAAAVIDAPMEIPIVPQQPDPDDKLQSYRDNWTAEVFDLGALAKYCVANIDTYIHLLEPCDTSLNQLARALKGAMNIPGVNAVNKRIAVMPREK